MAADQLVFWVFAPISIGSAIAMLLQRNAVHAALFLVVNFFTISVFYLVLGASFLFAVQIIVYAGAIMVLFLFVIMLLGVDREESLLERLRGQRVLGIALGVGIALELIVAIRAGVGFATLAPANFDEVANRGGNRRNSDLAVTIIEIFVMALRVLAQLRRPGSVHNRSLQSVLGSQGG